MPDDKPEASSSPASNPGSAPDSEASVEQVIEAAAGDGLPPDENKSAPASRKKRRIGPWLFLLLIIVGLPAAWLAAPPELRRQAMDLLNKVEQEAGSPATTAPEATPAIPGGESTTATEPAPSNEASTSDQQAAMQPATAEPPAATEPGTESANQPAEASAPETTATTTPAVSEEQLAALRDEITRLQGEVDTLNGKLNRLSTERDALTQKLHDSQADDARVRLALLASTDTRLEQRAALWNELASASSLDASRRQRAAETAAQLDHDIRQLAGWRQSLADLAARIPQSEQADILPKPKNPYFASLLGSFHLRPAPGPADESGDGLRRQLLAMQHSLALGDWPAARDWRHLLTALHEQFGDDADLGLPGTLDSITTDIDASRALASDWAGGH